MSSVLGSSQRPLRVAIVGSGPTAFYCTEALFTSKINVEVDVFERLPAPFGLVRYGVAPDHPKIKNVIKIYEKTALDPRFTYFGNVSVGRDISIHELRKFYDAIVFASGAQTDKPLGLPNENWPGSYTATEFVGWYNGHPDYQQHHFDLSHPVAVIMGMGNVAMDVARILAQSEEELAKTDITKEALLTLSKSKIRDIHIVGRRGPIQGAFTPIEIKEFGELPHADPIVKAEDLVLNEASTKELEDPKFPVRKKNFEILQKYSQIKSSKPRKIYFHFLKSPAEIKGNNKVEQIVLEKNVLSGEPGKQAATGTGQFETIDCGLIFRSVGYRGVAIPGVPFDEKNGIFPNLAGRISESGKTIPGLYVAGWIKRGPSGIIGTNKPDSHETIINLLADLPQLINCESPTRTSVKEFLNKRGIRFVSYEDWKKIDAAEIKRGESAGKPREKFTTVQEMLQSIA